MEDGVQTLFMACLNQDLTNQENASSSNPHHIPAESEAENAKANSHPRTSSKDDKIEKGKRQSRWNLPKETVCRVREGLGVKTALKLRNYSSW